MSRPATAAQSSSRTQWVDSRASRRRSVSATLAGMLGVLLPGALREQQPGQLADEERVTAAALPQPGADLRRSLRPGMSSTMACDLVRVEAGQHELLRTAGETQQPGRRLGVPVGADATTPCCRPGRGPGIPAAAADGSSAQCRSSITTSTRPVERPVLSGSRTPLRTAGTARRRRRRRSSTGRRCRCADSAVVSSSHPASPSSAVTVRWPAAPATTASTAALRCPPSKTPQHTNPGPAWSISADSTAVLPMPASPPISSNCPAPARASLEYGSGCGQPESRPTSRSDRTHRAIIDRSGPQFQHQIHRRRDAEPAARCESGLGCQRAQPLLTGLSTQRLRRRGGLLGHRVRRAGQRRDGVEHPPVRVEVVLHVSPPSGSNSSTAPVGATAARARRSAPRGSPMSCRESKKVIRS